MVARNSTEPGNRPRMAEFCFRVTAKDGSEGELYVTFTQLAAPTVDLSTGQKTCQFCWEKEMDVIWNNDGALLSALQRLPTMPVVNGEAAEAGLQLLEKLQSALPLDRFEVMPEAGSREGRSAP